MSSIADNVQESNGQGGSSGRDGQFEGDEEFGMRSECYSIFTASSWQYSLQWFMQWRNPKALMQSCSHIFLLLTASAKSTHCGPTNSYSDPAVRWLGAGLQHAGLSAPESI